MYAEERFDTKPAEAKPDNEHMRKWIKALRSGKYRKCTGQLRIKEQGWFGASYRYCALGVFAMANDIPLNEDGTEMMGSLGSCGVVLDYAPAERLIGDELSNVVMNWNDGDSDSLPLSFTQIADRLEQLSSTKETTRAA